ncbi:MAG: creatininase family protein, partial [Vicinamibacteria bacterium]
MKIGLSLSFLLLATNLLAQAGSPAPDEPRPIAAVDTVFIEDLTWMEVRDAIEDGKTTVIVATGGIEQNGPYLVTGKHNVVLRGVTESIARKLGNALVAPILSLVPEGDFDPPSGHMRYPGTIGLSEETFKAVLRDVGRSLKTHGFQN